MQQQFPNYIDYEDDYDRYYQKLTKGPFLDEISMKEAQDYFNNNIITTNIISYTFKYIQSQIHKNITLQTYFVVHSNQFDQIRTRIPQYAIIITFDYTKYGGMLWDTLNEQVFLINRNPQVEAAFTDQQIYRIQSYQKDLLSFIASVFIRILNSKDKDPNNINLILKEFSDQSLMKWVLLKQYRIKQMKLNNESYSRIFDQDFLREINQSYSKLNSNQHSQLQPLNQINNQCKSFSELSKVDQVSQNKNIQPASRLRQRSLFKITNKDSQTQEQIQKQIQKQPIVQNQQNINQKSNMLPQLNKYQKSNQCPQIIVQEPSNDQIDTIKESISVKDFLNGMNNLKQHILNTDPKDEKIIKTYPYFSPEQVLKLKLDDIEDILQEQIKDQKIKKMKPIEKLLYLLKYYSKHNPYQYQIIVNQFSDFIHDKLLENMGLPQALKNNAKEFQFSTNSFSKQLDKDLRINQDQVIDLNYNNKINMYEYNQLKDQLILSENIMDIYLNYLKDTFQRVLILPLEFYQILSQNLIKARSFTDKYQGSRNTIFDLFDQIIIPIKLTKNEYVGVYIDFNYKIMYFINTLARDDRKFPFQIEILDMPIMQLVVKFIKNEYNIKMMKSFNILTWSIFSIDNIQFVEFQNEYAQDISQSSLVLVYIIDSICNHENVLGSIQRLKLFRTKILEVIEKKTEQREMIFIK